MTGLTIVNTTDHPAHVVGAHGPAGPVEIAAKGRTALAPGLTFEVVAVMALRDGNTYRSNTLFLANNSQTVTASLVEDNGVFVLEIIATPGPIPHEIVLVSHCPEPVTFTITRT